jgi:Tol biopolymer transport system component
VSPGRLEVALLVAASLTATVIPAGDDARGRASNRPRIAFVRSGGEGHGRQLWTMRADGSHKERLSRGQFDAAPAWSPDGRFIAFHRINETGGDVYVMSARGKRLTRLTDAEGLDGFPVWSPGGKRIAYTHNSDARRLSRIFVVTRDGEDVERLTGKQRSSSLPSWSPRGGRIAFVRTRPCHGKRERCGIALFVMASDGSEKTRITPFDRSRTVTEYPDWSPDGRWIAFDRTGECCRHTGAWLVRPNGKDLHRITRKAVRHPSWSPDSRRLVVAYGRGRKNEDLWVMDRRGRLVRRLTRGARLDEEPSWSGPR